MESSPRPHRITIVLALLAATVSATGVYISYTNYVLNTSKGRDSPGGPPLGVPPSTNDTTHAPATESAPPAPPGVLLNLAGTWSAGSPHYVIITQTGDRLRLETYYKPTRSLRITCEGVIVGDSVEVDWTPNPSWQAPQRANYVGHFTGTPPARGAGNHVHRVPSGLQTPNGE
jgi:hypothetical protein